VDHHVHDHVHFHGAHGEGGDADGLGEVRLDAQGPQGGDGGVEALQVAHGGHEAAAALPGLGQGFQEGHAFLQVGGQGLLHDHVLAGLEHFEAQGMVEAGGRGDLHGVDPVQHVGHGGHPGGLELGGDLPAALLAGIHHGHQFGVLRRRSDPRMMLAEAADTDNRHAQSGHGCSLLISRSSA